MNLGQSETSCSLFVDELSEVSHSSYEAEWHALLSAEGWEEDNHFDGVNVMGNDNEFGSSIFNKRGHVVETILDVKGLWSCVTFIVSQLCKSLLFLRSSLRAVFRE